MASVTETRVGPRGRVASRTSSVAALDEPATQGRSRVLATTTPVPATGYQYWENVFVSPGARWEKSGWLSVKTPAISSM